MAAINNKKKRRVHQKIQRAVRYQMIVNKRRMTVMLSLALLIIVTLIAVWWTLKGQYEERTEDAYVEGNIVTLNAQRAGTVNGIYADNTDIVDKGDLLITLNSIDAELALEQAKADLGQTVRNLRNQFALKDQLTAVVEQRKAELLRAKNEYQRRLVLEAGHATSKEELQHAKQTLDSSRSQLVASEKELEGVAALIANTNIRTHPSVLNAMASLQSAYIQLLRTTLHAPVRGMVTKRNTQLGHYITPGTNLMAIVPLDHLWVSANFKESQLKNIRIGQSVTLHSDLYGRSVKFHGKVLGVDAGTGSAFSLLPAQNATGNWIKVVQRVPVRIELDPKEVEKFPLRVGLTMKVIVHTKEKGERSIVSQPIKGSSNYETDIYKPEEKQISQMIDEIIEANLLPLGS